MQGAHEVRTVMVACVVLVRNADGVRAEAQVQAEEVARRVAADPVHEEMALLEAMKVGHL